MSHRRPHRKTRLCGLLLALGLAGALGTTASATTTDAFTYDNSATTGVDIRLAGGDGTPALLSFYSEGANGLRLLENAFTDPSGHYAGDMRLPAHLTRVVVVIRDAGRQDTLTLPVSDQWIAYAE